MDSKKPQNSHTSQEHKFRFATVGLGYISQVAVLPAFTHAEECTLSALVSGDTKKLKHLGKKYHVDHLYSYDQYEECLRSGNIDAVYIALPNSMHCQAVVQAAEAGIHVLCEKPMAVNVSECETMIAACSANAVQLMIAYRLHFEAANLFVLDAARNGKIGDLILFNSTFSMQVKKDNIRVNPSLGGGALYDIGIYCINAARTLFEQEPEWVSGHISNPEDVRFEAVDGLISGTMGFGQGRLATFVTSFAAADIATYELVGTKGKIEVFEAFEFHSPITVKMTIGDKVSTKVFRKRDQFAPLLRELANAVREERDVSPSGYEGLADVAVIEAIYRSCYEGQRVALGGAKKLEAPITPARYQPAPAVREKKLFNAESPSQ